jgi:hypothetical protein
MDYVYLLFYRLPLRKAFDGLLRASYTPSGLARQHQPPLALKLS